MKNVSIPAFLFLCIFLSFNSNAQYCGNSGSGICAPNGSITTEGFYPADSALPCIIIGTYFDTVIQIHTPPSVSSGGSSYNLQSIKIESISNLPCGICWASGASDNTIGGNATGCLRLSGTTFDAPGEYLLSIIVDATVTYLGIPVTEDNQDLSSQGLKFYLRVKLPGGGCAPIDANSSGSTASTPGTISAPTISGNTTICSGASSTLTAIGGDYYGYVWSTGETTQSIQVSNGGIYTVTVYQNCASATGSQTISVNNVTPVISAQGPTTFCVGGNVTLDAGAGYAAYVWSNGATTQTVNVNQAGNYVCTVTQAGCQGASNVVNVIVNNNPTPNLTTSDPLSFCEGGSATLGVSNTYSSYLWNNGATTQSISVNQSGPYTCTVTQNGCPGASDTLTVDVINPQPTILSSGPTTLCAGQSDVLDVGAGFSSYHWSTGALTQTLNVSQAGTYSCTVTQGTCVGVSDTIIIAVGSTLQPVISANPSFNICPGSTATLDAGPGYDSYVWSSGGTNESISTASAGIYAITVTQGSCSGTGFVNVNVSNFPVNVNINPSGPVIVCAGTNVSLDGGGGYDSYSWSNGNTNEIIQPSSFGVYILNVTKNSCVGADTVSVSINPLPQPHIISSGNFCQGDTVTLDAGAGYTSYAWNTGVIAQTITAYLPNSYVVSVTDANNCSNADTLAVVFHPIPNPIINPSGNQIICSGQSVVFNAGSGFSSYLWSDGETSQIITVDTAVTLNVTVTQNGCTGSSTNSAGVAISIAPTVAITNTQISGTPLFELQAVATNVLIYTWQSAISDTVNGPFATVAHGSTDTASCFSSSGFYRVIVFNSNGCSDTSAFTYVMVCEGINDISALRDFSIEPNPVSEILTVNYELKTMTDISISVVDILGRRVMNETAEKGYSGLNTKQINVGQLVPGLYLLNFSTPQGNFNSRFVKR